jgi:hypothetical protein
MMDKREKVQQRYPIHEETVTFDGELGNYPGLDIFKTLEHCPQFSFAKTASVHPDCVVSHQDLLRRK